MTSRPPPKRFSWQTYDLRPVLPDGWQPAVLALAAAEGRIVMLNPTSDTSREAAGHAPLRSRIVDGKTLTARLPWLYDLYRGHLRDLIQDTHDEHITVAQDPRHGLLMQIQAETNARYECHIDAAPIAAILYATDQPPGSGGELTIANRGDVRGKAAVDADASRIHPVAGQLVVIDGHRHTHYVSALESSEAESLRVAIAMTFFTPERPESMRPADLDSHLGMTPGSPARPGTTEQLFGS
jgi:hypothetical protein